MKIYTIFAPQLLTPDNIIFINEGINIKAIIFNIFYCLYFKVWGLAALLVTYYLGLNVLEFFTPLESNFVLKILPFAFLGVYFNKFYKSKLINLKYSYIGTVCAANMEAAKEKFFHENSVIFN